MDVAIAMTLEFVGISKIYPATRGGADVKALDGINFEVRDREFLSLVGPSGCGKSTLLAIAAGLMRSTRGEARFDGAVIAGPDPRRGVLFQDYALFPWYTVMENVAFGPRAAGLSRAERREIAADYLARVGLRDFGDRYPHELSGGMRQRCALARMLANRPRVWLMDEPLAAVDLQTRNLLQDEILKLWGDFEPVDRRVSVLFVTHGIDEAVLMADRVVVLGRRPGRVREIVEVDVPRPRNDQRQSRRLAEVSAYIWSLIRDEAEAAMVEPEP